MWTNFLLGTLISRNGSLFLSICSIGSHLGIFSQLVEMTMLLAALHHLLFLLSYRFNTAAIDLINILLDVYICFIPLVAVFLICGLSLVAGRLPRVGSLL